MTLQAGGSAAQMVRDTGTANPVQGLWATGLVEGVELSSALPFTAFMQVGDGYAQQPLVTSSQAKLWIKVAGVWKEAITWIKVAGVWKQTTVWYNDNGTWK